MDFEHIVVGSGLVALAAVLALPRDARVLVLGGPASTSLSFYEAVSRVPYSCLGYGGLGNYWHGVIPLSLRPDYVHNCERDFRTLLGHFYPGEAMQSQVGREQVFVPLFPIRPRREWSRLKRDRGSRLDLRYIAVSRLEPHDRHVRVVSDAEVFNSAKVWIAAGTFGSAMLLRRSGLTEDVTRLVSDHAICYLGQMRDPCQRTFGLAGRNRHGYFLKAQEGALGQALVTVKPARFDYKYLDRGIQQRAAFGLPVAGALAKILRASSPGLVAEALFNKFGLFPRASLHSVYAQVKVPAALEFGRDGSVGVRTARYVNACAQVRAEIHLPGITPSRLLDPFIFGIHTHGSLPENSASVAGDMIRVLDASVLPDIGVEHHSFYIMSLAHQIVRRNENES